MPSCIVQGCTSSSKTKDPAPVLHAFPPEVENVRTWLLQTKQDFENMEEFIKKIVEAPRGSYRMCSLHFGKECYEIRGRSFFLKKGAIPTIFPKRKASGDEIEEGPHKPLKRSKRGVNVTLTEARMATMDHSYAGTIQTPVPNTSSGNQVFGISSTINESTVEVEIMPDSPTNIPLEDTLPRFARRKKIKLPPPTKSFCKVTDNYSRQVHRSTNTDPYFGKSHKKNSANLRPKHFSIGIQCNLSNSSTLQDDMTRQTMPPIDTVALSNRIRKMVLHRGRVYVALI